jgi:hypothetical protein
MGARTYIPDDGTGSGGTWMRMSRRGGASLSLASVAAAVMVAMAAGSGGAAPATLPVGPSFRVAPGVRLEAVPAAARTAVPQANAALVTVDTLHYSGFENAIWASGRQRVYVAYKRFPSQPAGTNGEVRLARLCVARSADGGATWTTSVVDPYAGDVGDTIDDSVAIGGSGKTIYVAYLAQSGTSTKP